MFNILIAEGHPLVITGIESALARDEIAISDKVSRIGDVLDRYDEALHSVVIIGVSFTDGLDLAYEILLKLIEKDPHVKVMMLSQYESIESIKEAYSLGVKAYIPKSLEFDVTEVITTVASNKEYFHPSIATRLAKFAVSGAGMGVSPIEALSTLEIKCFTLAAQGYNQREIAEEMGVALRTINNMFASIKAKLNIERQADFTILAIKKKLIDINEPINRRSTSEADN